MTMYKKQRDRTTTKLLRNYYEIQKNELRSKKMNYVVWHFTTKLLLYIQGFKQLCSNVVGGEVFLRYYGLFHCYSSTTKLLLRNSIFQRKKGAINGDYAHLESPSFETQEKQGINGGLNYVKRDR